MVSGYEQGVHLQWDTVVGDEIVPHGPYYRGLPGHPTWHLGIRAQGEWRTDPDTGRFGGLPAGTHHLELVGNGVPYGGGRTITVVFADGSRLSRFLDLGDQSAIAERISR